MFLSFDLGHVRHSVEQSIELGILDCGASLWRLVSKPSVDNGFSRWLWALVFVVCV